MSESNVNSLDSSKFAEAFGLLRDGRIDEARQLILVLLGEAPDFPPLLQLAAVAALRAGDQKSALALATKSLRLRPDHPATLLIAGRAARELSDLGGATDFFRSATRAAPDLAEPAFLLCASLLDAGDDEARVWLSQLPERFPDDAQGWGEIGLTLWRARRHEDSLSAFARACRAAPSCELHLRRATVLRVLGRTGEAIAAYERAAALAPESFDAAFGLGLLLKEASQFEAAAAALRNAILLQPGAARAWFALGVVEQDRRSISEAAAAYEKALEYEPAMAEAAVNLGICRQQQGDLDAAKSAYRRAMRVRPETFGRIAQAMTMAAKGELWLDLRALRASLM